MGGIIRKSGQINGRFDAARSEIPAPHHGLYGTKRERFAQERLEKSLIRQNSKLQLNHFLKRPPQTSQLSLNIAKTCRNLLKCAVLTVVLR